MTPALTAASAACLLTAGSLVAQGAPGRNPPASGGRGATRADPIEVIQYRQAQRLPPLPPAVTLALIQQGDSVFHFNGGCLACHGAEGEGVRRAGSALTGGLHFVAPQPQVIDSLVRSGIPDGVTRSPMAMPPRGAGSNLSDGDIRAVAAYVWAITHTLDEPWPGGHRRHAPTASSASKR